MKKYKVYTKWIGYSEIKVKAKSKEEAEQKYYDGDYHVYDESTTGGDLEYGFDDEEVTKIEEVNDDQSLDEILEKSVEDTSLEDILKIADHLDKQAN